MPDTKRQQSEHDILQLGKVNVGNNTLFVRAQRMDVDDQHLTLVISTGGSGASAIRQAVRMANERLNPAYTNYVKFIMIDSATNEIGKDREGIITLNTSSTGARERLKKETRPVFYKTFMPDRYDTDLLNPFGAGQNRMTGKVKFYDKDADPSVDRYNDQKLREAIQDIFQGDWASYVGNRVDIMILSGLAGGNGSGTFLDVAAHARYACRQASPTSTISVFGYLFLPDTMKNHVKKGTDMKPMYANGYAALKELESYMSIPFHTYRMESFRSANGQSINVDKHNNLFDYPILISGGYDETVSMIAENILNMIGKYGNAKGKDGKITVFDQNSFYSNTQVMRSSTFEGIGENGIVPDNQFLEDSRSYCAIGYASVGFPDEIVTANIVGHVMANVFAQEKIDGTVVGFCRQNKRDCFSVEVMKNCIRTLLGLEGTNVELTERTLWDYVMASYVDTAEMSSTNDNINTIAQIESGDISNYRDGFGIEMAVPEKTRGAKDSLANWMTNFKDRAKGVMKQYGPRALQFLYEGIGPNDKDGNTTVYAANIKAMLDYAKGMMKQEAEKKAQYPDNQIGGGFFSNALNNHITKTKINKWKTDYVTAVKDEVWFRVWKDVTGTGGAWAQLRDEMTDYLEKVKTFAERLELLQDDYFSLGASLDTPDMGRFLEQSDVVNCVNLCSDQNAYDWVRQTVQQKINGIITGNVRDALVDSFCAHKDKWCSSTEGEARKEFDSVMSSCCQLGINAGKADLGLSTQSYFAHLVEGLDPDVQVEQITKILEKEIEGISRKLQTMSAPKIHLGVGVKQHINVFVLIPGNLVNGQKNGQIICEAFRRCLNGAVVISPSVKDVVCYQTSVANAISDVLELPEWEREYQVEKGDDRRPVHLNMGEFRYGGDYVERTKEAIDRDRETLRGGTYQSLGLSDTENIIFGTGLSWAHYPEIDLHNLENNTSEQEFLDKIFNPIVDYALEKKLIDIVGNIQGTHKYVVHLLPESWKNLDMSLYKLKDNDTGLYVRGSRLFDYLAGMNQDTTAVYTEDIELAGAGIFGRKFNFANANKTPRQMKEIGEHYMRRILRKNTKLFLDLRKTLNRYYEVEKQLESKESELIHQNNIEKFVEYYRLGVVKQRTDKLKQNIWSYSTMQGIDKDFGIRFSETWERRLRLSRNPSDQNKVKIYNEGLTFLLALKEYEDGVDADLNTVYQNVSQDPVKAAQAEKENNPTLAEWKRKIDDLREGAGWVNELEDKIPKGLFGKTYVNLSEEERYYVDTIEFMDGLLLGPSEQDSPVPDSTEKAVQPIKRTAPPTTWRCPKCGGEWENTMRFCPNDGTPPKPVSAPRWRCPKCGGEWEDTMRFCPNDGTPKPEPALKWKCPKCGGEWEDTMRFCPNDGTPKPAGGASQPAHIIPPTTWKCPKCGGEWEDTVRFCPNDGTPPKPVSAPRWRCPTCGGEWEDTMKFCSNDGTPKPAGGASQPAHIIPPTTWKCPTCGKEMDRTMKFCSNDGTRQPG